MFHLRNKSHLSNSKATQLALRSNWMCKTGFGNFLTGEELSKQELFRIERDQAVQKLAECKSHHKGLVSVLNDHFKKGGATTDPSIVIKSSDVEKIDSIPIRILIASVLGIELKEKRAEEA